MLRKDCINNLQEIRRLLCSLSDQQYIRPCQLLSEATLGQHVRHIVEFYQAVLVPDMPRRVNYDDRKRDIRIETSIQFACSLIDSLTDQINRLESDFPVKLTGNYGALDANLEVIDSSLFRELAYCMEHSIHHQALIKIALMEQRIDHLISDDFGVAPATIRFRNQTLTHASA